ncbi:MAG TPA: cytochrome c biogenesis protein CcsA [Bdellovibrionota bacterium]|jgi:ABC-type transport system involved in cytochrome c biogenesis permease subunit
MKAIGLLTLLLAFLLPLSAHAGLDEAALEKFKAYASSIDTKIIDPMPVQNHGRIKPFQTYAREATLYLTGKYGILGLSASQLLLAIVTSEAAPDLELINVRDVALRLPLDLPKDRKIFTLREIESSRLASLAGPVMEKQKLDEKSLNQTDKNIIEVAQQMWLLRSVIQGEFFFSAIDLDPKPSESPHGGKPELASAFAAYLRSLQMNSSQQAKEAAEALVAKVRSQDVPEVFRAYMDKMSTEVLYNRLHLFFFAGLLYCVVGLIFASGLMSQKFTNPLRVLSLVLFPFLLHVSGFAMRVYITGFAPVTNMYGTMVWMALGVVAFGSLLYFWYRHLFVYGILLLGASLTLILTESIPLILSPDLDPVVAVLRSNFWLTIHVLTVTISYAAFTIAMLTGNTAIVRTLLKGGALPQAAVEEMAKICYRIIQIGVLLLTTGIILGGWWADYSWGRFWGWDPKETWALIADLGFLALLHARYAGWANSFVLLALSPVAYLLVLMAWYGVNFILAAGLHSYGFSSGGTIAVVTFVVVQVILIALAAWTLRGKFTALLQRPGA